jgi:HNH endonuclease
LDYGQRTRRRFFSADERDAMWHAQNGKCPNPLNNPACEGDLTLWGKGAAHADHIIPFAAGGPTDITNGQMLCAPCNLRKAAKMPYAQPEFNAADYAFGFDKSAYRADQLTAHEAIMRFIKRGDSEIGLLAHPRFGKTDLAHNIAIEAVESGLVALGLFINTRIALKQQCVDERKLAQMRERYRYRNHSAIGGRVRAVDGHHLKQLANKELYNAWPNQREYLFSLTAQQMLTGQGERGVALLIDRAHALTGLPTLLIVDECQDFAEGEGRQFFDAIRKLMNTGKVVVLSMTGTAERDDGLIPIGFKATQAGETETGTRVVYKGRLGPEHEQYDPDKTLAEFAELETAKTPINVSPIHAALEFKLERGFEVGTVCSMSPRRIDTPATITDEAGVVRWDGKLSDASASELARYRLLSRYVLDRTVIKQAAVKVLDALEEMSHTGVRPKAMVFTVDDRGTEESNAHAKAFQEEFHAEAKRRGKQLSSSIITMSAAEEQNLAQAKMLADFRDDDTDIAILKKSGAVGFDCSRVKVVCDLSGIRSSTMSIQLWLRCATPHQLPDGRLIDHCILIFPADAKATALYDKYIGGAGGTTEQKSSVETRSFVSEVEDQDQPDDFLEVGEFIDTVSYDTLGNLVRSSDHAVVAVFAEHFPKWAAGDVSDPIAKRAELYRKFMPPELMALVADRMAGARPDDAAGAGNGISAEQAVKQARERAEALRWRALCGWAATVRGDGTLLPYIRTPRNEMPKLTIERVQSHGKAFAAYLASRFGTSRPSQMTDIGQLQELNAHLKELGKGASNAN